MCRRAALHSAPLGTLECIDRQHAFRGSTIGTTGGQSQLATGGRWKRIPASGEIRRDVNRSIPIARIERCQESVAHGSGRVQRLGTRCATRDGPILFNDCRRKLLFPNIQTLVQLSLIGDQPYCGLPPGIDGSSLHVGLSIRRAEIRSRLLHGRAVRVCAHNAQRAGWRRNKSESSQTGRSSWVSCREEESSLSSNRLERRVRRKPVRHHRFLAHAPLIKAIR